MATAKKAPAKTAPAAKKAAAPAKKRTPNAAFMKALTPSPALAAVVGSAPLPRTEIISKLWVYIKANNLQDATNKAVSIMQGACPDETPLTPPGRLAAMQTRLQAMIDAANTVKPSLDSFYASLDNEQKARFNRIGELLAQSGE